MEKKSKKSIVIGITSLFLVTLLLVGLTYAYYRTRIIGNDSTDPSISVQSKKMEIVYEDGTSEMNMTGKIEPGFTATKTFSVENTGDEAITFSIMLDNVTNTFTRKSDWTYTLKKSGVTDPIASGEVPSSTTYIVPSATIASKTKETYTLTITYAKLDDVDQSDDMGMSLSFRVNIGEEKITWDNAPQGTLLAAVKANNPSVHTNMDFELENRNEVYFIPEEEVGLALYEGNYYFRGEVENNYVSFDGKTWRIVEINEYGIKLVSASEHINGNADDETNKILDFRQSATYQDLKTWYNTEITTKAKEKTVEGTFTHIACDSKEDISNGNCYFASDMSYAGTLSFKDFLLASGEDMSYYTDEVLYNNSNPEWYDNNAYKYTYIINEVISAKTFTIGALDLIDYFDDGYIEYFRQDADYMFGTMNISGISYLPVIHLNNNVTLTGNGNGEKDTPYVIS